MTFRCAESLRFESDKQLVKACLMHDSVAWQQARQQPRPDHAVQS
jgi:hypothetical protein